MNACQPYGSTCHGDITIGGSVSGNIHLVCGGELSTGQGCGYTLGSSLGGGILLVGHGTIGVAGLGAIGLDIARLAGSIFYHLANIFRAIGLALAIAVGIRHGSANVVYIDIGADGAQSCAGIYGYNIQIPGFISLHSNVLGFNGATCYAGGGAAVDIVYRYTYTNISQASIGNSIGAVEIYIIVGLYLGIILGFNTGAIYRGCYGIVHIINADGNPHGAADAHSQTCLNSLIGDIVYIVGCYQHITCCGLYLSRFQGCLSGAAIINGSHTCTGRYSDITARARVCTQMGLGLLGSICLNHRTIFSSNLSGIYYGLGGTGEGIEADSACNSTCTIRAHTYIGSLLYQGHISCRGGLGGQILGGNITAINGRSGIAGEIVLVYSGSGCCSDFSGNTYVQGTNNAVDISVVMSQNSYLAGSRILGKILIYLGITELCLGFSINGIEGYCSIYSSCSSSTKGYTTGYSYIFQGLLAVGIHYQAIAIYGIGGHSALLVLGIFRGGFSLAVFSSGDLVSRITPQCLDIGVSYQCLGIPFDGVGGNGQAQTYGQLAATSYTEAAAIVLESIGIVGLYSHIVGSINGAMADFSLHIIIQLVDSYIDLASNAGIGSQGCTGTYAYIEDFPVAISLDREVLYILGAVGQGGLGVAYQGIDSNASHEAKILICSQACTNTGGSIGNPAGAFSRYINLGNLLSRRSSLGVIIGLILRLRICCLWNINIGIVHSSQAVLVNLGYSAATLGRYARLAASLNRAADSHSGQSIIIHRLDANLWQDFRFSSC